MKLKNLNVEEDEGYEEEVPPLVLRMANMKMANPIKGLVSKRRKRYTQDGFNLDLTCILYLQSQSLHSFSVI